MDLSSIDPALIELTERWLFRSAWGAGLLTVAFFFRIAGSKPEDVIRALRGR